MSQTRNITKLCYVDLSYVITAEDFWLRRGIYMVDGGRTQGDVLQHLANKGSAKICLFLDELQQVFIDVGVLNAAKFFFLHCATHFHIWIIAP
jgi:hypothetical protein